MHPLHNTRIKNTSLLRIADQASNPGLRRPKGIYYSRGAGDSFWLIILPDF